MNNLIPIAGAGARFSAEGCKTPKPLIEVSGRPMVMQAALSLPPAKRWVFICRMEHTEKYRIDEMLKKEFTGSEIVTVDYPTEGQACSCLLAEDVIERQEPLLISACDNGSVWSREKYEALLADEKVDAVIWTFRNNATVKRNPHMYGWVITGDDGDVRYVSCKVPISNNPVNDHAIAGTFYFRRASYFFDSAKGMIAKGRRVNNEFYVDEAMNELIESGLKVKVFEVEKYICWGTPDDVRTYRYWESYFGRKVFSPRNSGSSG